MRSSLRWKSQNKSKPLILTIMSHEQEADLDGRQRQPILVNENTHRQHGRQATGGAADIVFPQQQECYLRRCALACLHLHELCFVSMHARQLAFIKYVKFNYITSPGSYGQIGAAGSLAGLDPVTGISAEVTDDPK